MVIPYSIWIHCDDWSAFTNPEAVCNAHLDSLGIAQTPTFSQYRPKDLLK
jgi:hypothetical protein